MIFLRRNKNLLNTSVFNEADYSVLDYEQLLKVNGAGGGSGGGGSGPSGGSDHYNRNDYNTDLPSSPEEAKESGWIKMDEDKDMYHEQGTASNYDPKNNDKYVSPDGHKEVVYNEKGDIVTDPVNMGTYNYADPNTDPVGHFFKDMVPYYINGNSPDDPTNMWERITGTYSGKVD